MTMHGQSHIKLGCEFRKSDSGVYSSDEINFDPYCAIVKRPFKKPSNYLTNVILIYYEI